MEFNTFSPAKTWANTDYQLRVLSPKFAEQDYEAVRASSEDIRHVFGPDNSWPSETISFEQNLADLIRHEDEFYEQKAYAYAIFDVEGVEYLGCVYVDPVKSTLENDARKTQFDAEVYFWLSSLQTQLTNDVLLASLKTWFAADWPLKKIAFPGREITWQAWQAMAQ